MPLQPQKCPWTPAQVELLTRLWAEGLSASQIAKAFPRDARVTRNSVIGKVHRLGLAGGKTYARTNLVRPKKPRTASPGRVYQRPANVAKQIQTAAPKMRVVEPVEPLNVPFAELQAFQCKAVIDNTPYVQTFCGHMRDEASPYCAAHRARFYVVEKVRAA